MHISVEDIWNEKSSLKKKNFSVKLWITCKYLFNNFRMLWMCFFLVCGTCNCSNSVIILDWGIFWIKLKFSCLDCQFWWFKICWNNVMLLIHVDRNTSMAYTSLFFSCVMFMIYLVIYQVDDISSWWYIFCRNPQMFVMGVYTSFAVLL